MLQLLMRRDKQKKEDSQDEFEDIKEELETLHQRRMDSPPKNNIKNHPRMQYMAEKHKLGFIPNKQTPQVPNQNHQKKESHNHVGKIIKIGSVTFRSNFECGSIGSVELIGVNSFKIFLDNETNSERGNTWFDFIVEGLKGEASFAITGFRKKASLYNEGMKICYREVHKNGKWKRGGTQVCYVKNMEEEQKDLKRYDIKFNFNFKDTSSNGIEFAYCFPYGFNKLQQLLAFLHSKVKIQTLASSFQGNDLPLINLGNLSSKQVIVLSARVHPGETVSSLMMDGLLKEIVSDSEFARFLRQRFLFKIMPMINVDGVKHGNFRFSASGVDLNRRWQNPSEEHYPEIYYLKQMVIRQNKQKSVKMYIDMHGHSRKKNVFFYGCCQESQNIMDSFHPKAFPFLMSKVHEAFNYHDCSFVMQEDKEGTARIALWKELKINQIYTLEASFCSSAKGHNYLEADYQKIGQKLCEGIAMYFYQPSMKAYPQLSKLVNFREVAYNELKNDVELLKLGNESNVGSDSEPEKGERTEVSKNRKTEFKITNKVRQESEAMDHKTQGNKSVHNHVQNSPIVQTNQKHKSQADMNERQSFQANHLKDLLPLLKPVIKTDHNYDRKQRGTQTSKNIRVHLSKGNTVPTSNLALYTDQPINEEELYKKEERRMATHFETTQYRRIKNMMEQKNAIRESKNSPHTLVQSINPRKIEMESNHKGVIPRFYANTPFKKRKNSVQIFYNKANKSMPKPNKEGNVICQGRQIKF